MRAAIADALDAERAFAADAQALGQWTAFRKWAAADATMFVPQPVEAQAWLKDRADPARAIAWWPTAAWTSCDGRMMIDTGGWQRPDGSVGYFTTVWQRQPDGGWRWIVDGGDALGTARPRVAQPVVRRASCKPVRAATTVRLPDGAARLGMKGAADGTLRYVWQVMPDGARTFTATLWNGTANETVVDDRIAAPAP